METPCNCWLEEKENEEERKSIQREVGRGREEEHGGVCDVILLRERERERGERGHFIWQIARPPLGSCKFSFRLRHCTRVFSFPRSCSIQNLPSHLANLATNNLPVVHKIFSTSVVMFSHRVLGVVFVRKIAPS